MASFEPNAPSCVCLPGQCECSSYGSTDGAVEELLTNSEGLEPEVPSGSGLEVALRDQLKREGGEMSEKDEGSISTASTSDSDNTRERGKGRPQQQ